MSISVAGPLTSAQTSASQPTTPQPRLVKAAHEFEAAMMKELLAPLDASQEDDAGGSGSALTAFAGESLGKAISAHGGFGIADRIIGQLSAAGNHSGKPAVPSVSNRHFVISALK